MPLFLYEYLQKLLMVQFEFTIQIVSNFKSASEMKIIYFGVLTWRVHTLRETDFRGHWRVDLWYLKMKPSAHIFVQWSLSLEIWSISSQIFSILSINDVSSIDCHIASIQDTKTRIKNYKSRQ